jgi:hypothetical protein
MASHMNRGLVSANRMQQTEIDGKVIVHMVQLCSLPGIALMCFSLRLVQHISCSSFNFNPSALQQVLLTHAEEIARQYQFDQDKWLTSARRLRAPYWDWAANPNVPEYLFSTPQIGIIGFNGGTVYVNNPLWGYVFHPTLPGEWARYRKTVRYPDPRNGQDTPSRMRS